MSRPGKTVTSPINAFKAAVCGITSSITHFS
jgi:hypothetical protein